MNHHEKFFRLYREGTIGAWAPRQSHADALAAATERSLLEGLRGRHLRRGPSPGDLAIDDDDAYHETRACWATPAFQASAGQWAMSSAYTAVDRAR